MSDSGGGGGGDKGGGKGGGGSLGLSSPSAGTSTGILTPAVSTASGGGSTDASSPLSLAPPGVDYGTTPLGSTVPATPGGGAMASQLAADPLGGGGTSTLETLTGGGAAAPAAPSGGGDVPLPQPRPAGAGASAPVPASTSSIANPAGITLPAAPTAPAPAPTGGGGGASAEDAMKKLGITPSSLASGAGLIESLIQGNKPPQGTEQLKGTAAQLAAQAGELRSYLQSGTLPPGVKTAVDQATAAAKARAVSNFASQGMSTDPTKNSALAAELNAIDQQAAISTAQIGQQLLQTGINETGLATNIYEALVKIDQTQNQQVSQAIANFAAALGGGGATKAGGKTITIS